MNITKESINNDIKVFYVKAESFPDGAYEAHQKLHSLIPYSSDRKYFGISRPQNGVIVYMAAAEELIPKEGEKVGCESLILKKGNYVCITINNYLKDLQSIGKAFEILISKPEIDAQGYCVEWYFSDKDVKCMVRLEE